MGRIKKILFLGNFSIDYCTEVHHAKTYEKLGVEVIRMQEGRVSAGEIIAKIAEEGCDAFNWTHTHGWNTPEIESVLNYCRLKGIPTYGYHLDLWLGIEREKDLKRDPFWKVDHFFSVDQEMVDLLNSRDDLPKGHFLPAGVFEDECYIAEPNREKYPHDIIFVGSRGYHPEWPYRKQLIEWLENEYGNRFAQYGGGGLGTIRGHELNVLYASAKVVIGDTLCPNFNKPYYLSDRIFETTGRGGLLIHPYIRGMEELFLIPDNNGSWVDGCEVLTYPYQNFSCLKTCINMCLDEDVSEIINNVRIDGHNRTKKDHTYTQRLSKLLNILENE